MQEYEVTLPQVVTNTGSFLSNELKDAIGSERLHIRFRAFGEEFLLDLRKNRKLMDPRFTSEILHNFHQPPRANLSRDCYYTGTLRFRSQSSVAISGCHGLVRLITSLCLLREDRFVDKLFLILVLTYPGKIFIASSSLLSSQVQVLNFYPCVTKSRLLKVCPGRLS